MLAFPQRLLAGERPHVDFLHLYGPASLYVLAGAFKVFGATIQSERFVGFLQLVTAIVGVAWFARPWGRWVASCMSMVAIGMCFWPLGLTAMAWNGAVAWGMLMLVFLRRSLFRVGSGRFDLIIAGFCGAVALAYRPDLAAAVALALGALFVVGRDSSPGSRPGFRPILLGAAPVIVASGAFVLWVGIGTAWNGMFVEPVFHLRGGRSLPVPPSWGHRDGFLQRAELLAHIKWPLPMIDPSHQIFLWFWAVVIGAFAPLVIMIRRWRQGHRTPADASLLIASSFILGLLPQALQRPDTTHLAWVSYISLPIGLLVIVHCWRNSHWPRSTGPMIAALTTVLLFGVIAPYYPLRGSTELFRKAVGAQPVGGHRVERGQYSYYLAAPETARDAQTLFDHLDAVAKPGDRLFVGPRDLRYTNYSDAYIYGMFPDLKPATRYIEMDPGVTNTATSGLAREVESADWAVLSATAETWREPNSSATAGSPEPNEVVKAHFCQTLHTPHFDLLRRCR